jgi:serine/threonine protein kinase
MTTGGQGGSPAAPGPWRATPAGRPTSANTGGPAAGIVGYGQLELIAHGSSALIYRGIQQRVDRVVAIKVLTVDEETTQRHIQREVDLTVKLSSHPHIVSIIDTGMTATGNPYIVMEYCEGGSYAEILRKQGPRPVGEVIDVGIKIGEALHAAHGVGIIHRDVKPPNILRSRFGPALADFGIARAADDLSSTHTLDKLTPYHASPEALERRTQSFRSDIYSLASTLWHLLSGRAPFIDPTEQVQDVVQFRLRVLTAPVPPIPRADVPAWLEAELVRAMSKDEQHRHATALEFAQVLREGGSWTAGGWAGHASPPDAGTSYAPDPWAPTSTPPATPFAAPDPDRTVVARPGETTGPGSGGGYNTPAPPRAVPPNVAPPGPPPAAGPDPSWRVAAPVSAGPLSSAPASAPPVSTPPISTPPTPVSGTPQVSAAPVSTPPAEATVTVSPVQTSPPAPVQSPSPWAPGAAQPPYPPPYQPPAPQPPQPLPAPAPPRRKLGVPLLVAAIIGLVLGIAVVAVLGSSLVRPTPNPTPTIPATLTKENAPTDVRITNDQRSSVTLAWKDHTGGAASYVISVVRQDAGHKAVPQAVGAGMQSTTIVGLDPTIDYCFVAAAVLDVGNLAVAEPVCTHRR